MVLHADVKAHDSPGFTPGNIRNDFLLFADSANSDFIALRFERCLCDAVQPGAVSQLITGLRIMPRESASW